MPKKSHIGTLKSPSWKEKKSLQTTNFGVQNVSFQGCNLTTVWSVRFPHFLFAFLVLLVGGSIWKSAFQQQCMWLSRLWFQQMFNWWFGDRWFGILGVPPSNNPFHKGIPGIQTTIFIYLGSIIKINPMYIFIIPKYILYIYSIYILVFYIYNLLWTHKFGVV